MSTTGFYQTAQGLTIEKDPEAQLTYTFDWAQWLPQGDSIDTSDYAVTARVNDPDPLLKVSAGKLGTKTYVELSGGQEGKTYIVTNTIETVDGNKDRRFFRVKVENRSA